MKSNTKKALWITGIAVSALAVFTSKKMAKAQKIIDHLEINIKRIKNIKLDWQKVKFDVDLTLINPTNIDFGVTATSRIFVKRLNIYSNTGKLIGFGTTKLYDIQLPANGSYNLPTITINATVSEAVKHLFSENIDNINYSLEIEAFGNTFTVEPTI